MSENHEIVVVIRPSFKKFCGADACRAATFNHLLYWIARKAKKQSAEKIKSGSVSWYGTADEICNDLDNSWCINKVRKEIKELVTTGLIGQRRNPENGWDQTRHYFFGEEQGKVLREACEEHNICLYHLGLQPDIIHLLNMVNAIAKDGKCNCQISEMDLPNMAFPITKDGNAIPQITTKITNSDKDTYSANAFSAIRENYVVSSRSSENDAFTPYSFPSIIPDNDSGMRPSTVVIAMEDWLGSHPASNTLSLEDASSSYRVGGNLPIPTDNPSVTNTTPCDTALQETERDASSATIPQPETDSPEFASESEIEAVVTSEAQEVPHQGYEQSESVSGNGGEHDEQQASDNSCSHDVATKNDALLDNAEPEPEASSTGKRDEKLPRTRRKPKTPEEDEAMKERVKKFFETFVALAQEMFNDPDFSPRCPSIKGEVGKEIVTLIKQKASPDGVRSAFMDMWNEKNRDGEYWWRDPKHLTIKAFCHQYPTRIASIKFKAKQAKEQEQKPKSVSGLPNFTLNRPPREPKQEDVLQVLDQVDAIPASLPQADDRPVRHLRLRRVSSFAQSLSSAGNQ